MTKAALRLRGRGGRFGVVRYGVVCENRYVRRGPSRLGVRLQPRLDPLRMQTSNQHPPESLTAASSIVRCATSQEESPANLSTVPLAPPPLLQPLQLPCPSSALVFVWLRSASPAPCSTHRLWLSHSRPK